MNGSYSERIDVKMGRGVVVIREDASAVLWIPTRGQPASLPRAHVAHTTSMRVQHAQSHWLTGSNLTGLLLGAFSRASVFDVQISRYMYSTDKGVLVRSGVV